MERWVGKTAIVTGAVGGMGYAITEKLLDDGVQVVGVDFTKDKLDELKISLKHKKGNFFAYNADLRKEDDILNLFKWTKTNVGPIHILVNCAGIFRMTTLTEGDTQMWKDVMDTNFIALCITSREAVQDMRANKVDGHIINISSTAGLKILQMPGLNVYGPSKHAVCAFTETLKYELNSYGDKIKVSCISPGATDTGIELRSALGSGLSEVPDTLKNMLKTMPFINPQDIADAVRYVLSTPPHVQIAQMTIQPVGESI